jgi:hypothetical protein
MNPSRLLAITSFSFVVVAAGSSFAQQPPSGSPPPPYGAPPPGSPPPGSPPPAYGAPPPGAPPPAYGAPPPAYGAPPPGYAPAPGYPPGYAPPPEDPNATRFRWGISGFGGKYFVGGQSGTLYGIDMRFGAQINQMFAVYGSPIILGGAGVSGTNSSTGSTASVNAFALYGIGALFDVTLEDMVYLAAGPEVLSGGGGGINAKSDGSGNVSAEAGTFLGVEGRAGLAFGSIKPARRKCFTIGVDLHAVFMNKTVVFPVLTLGYDSF